MFRNWTPRFCNSVTVFTMFFAVVKLEILLHLRFLFAFGRLVDRKFYETISIAHHFAHERRVLGRDVLIVEAEDVSEAHHILVKLHPRIHLVPAYIAHAMIDILQTGLRRIVMRLPFAEARHEWAMIILPFDKEMDDLAISVNATHHNFAIVVLQGLWLHITLAAALGRFFPR